MKRHPVNRNLTLYNEETYLDMPIQIAKGPFILEYLQRLHATILRSVREYREVFAFRFDLRLPSAPSGIALDAANERELLYCFLESFKAKIRHNRTVAMSRNKFAHDTVVRYVWTREVGSNGRAHYHFAVMLNHDAYCTLGYYSLDRDNIFSRLHEAWASALSMEIEDVAGLVEIPKNPSYRISGTDSGSVREFFFRASYLCKSATKRFGNGWHGFGASRS